ncbi:MAG TPA: ATP-binding protein [Polyangia bacterium]|nr:ATP-binding protein [Polyangia bacterium]
MQTSAGIIFGLVGLAAIVGIAMSSAAVEQDRLLTEFQAEAQRQVRASAEALSHLDSLHQDVRMLADLVERSRRDMAPDTVTERRVWESAFHALAVVVVHYRLIALVDGQGQVEVQAIDPTEAPDTATVLMPPVRRLGAEAAVAGVERLGRSVRIGRRSFLLHATPVHGGGAIVLASDAALLLRTVAWPQLRDGRLVVTDPSGVVWSGCETPAGCALADGAGGAISGASGRANHVDAAEAARLGLFRAPALRLSEDVVRPTGNWRVTWITSTQPSLDRARAGIERIVAAAVSAALIVAVVGLILYRQQRRAVDLASQLRYAKTLARSHELENELVRADRLITVGVMATEIAHEIGTPLGVVRGRAEQVLRAPAGVAGGEDLRVVIKMVDNISATVRQLLDFSRRSPLDKRSISLADVVERTQELLQFKLEARHLQLVLSLSDDLPMLTADPDQLQQVLVNLLLNACDASAPNNRVILAARRAPGDMVRIEVTDGGTGIAPEHLDTIFEPFFTTKPRGEGTGLGLAISAGIVRNHAGQIDVRSKVGEGTTITVVWPASPTTEK